ncbi:OmpP1/FadL family transporter [Candidatus Latescibacterota bacterium]
MRTFISSLFLVAALCFFSQTADATNGMSMIGYGARMSGMGGTSLGMKNDTNLMNTNPAGITSIKGQRVDGSLGLLIPSTHYKNTLNDIDSDTAVFPLPSIGYVRNPEDSPFAFGIGLFAQGGMGATYPGAKHAMFRDYQNDPTALVSTEYHSNIAYLKLAPTIAYEIMPELSVGLSLNVGYAMMEMKMPYSLPAAAMQGVIPGMGGMTFGGLFGAPMEQGGLGYEEVTAYADMGDAVTALGYGAKLGVQYQPTDKLTFGASYTMKSTLDFSGEAKMDMTAQFGDAYGKMVAGAMQANPDLTQAQAMEGVGQQLAGMGIDMSKGMQDDYDTDIEFSWPQEFGIGTAYEANDRLTLAADIRWINWEDSMEKFVLDLSGGSNDNINAMMGTPDGDMKLEMPLNWDNQVAISIGAEYMATDTIDLRAGYNFAPNPVPASTVIPIFPAVVENHLTLGIGYRFTELLRIDAAYELALSKELKADDSIIANEYDGHTSKLGENILHVTASFVF